MRFVPALSARLILASAQLDGRDYHRKLVAMREEEAFAPVARQLIYSVFGA